LALPGSRDPGIPEVLIPNPGIEKQGPGLQSLRMTLSHIIFYRAMHYTAKRGIAIACRLPVCLSVCTSVRDVGGSGQRWKSWKPIARTISATHSLFVAQMPYTNSQGNMGKVWGD